MIPARARSQELRREWKVFYFCADPHKIRSITNVTTFTDLAQLPGLMKRAGGRLRALTEMPDGANAYPAYSIYYL